MLLRDKDLAQQFTNFVGGLFNTIQSLTGKKREENEETNEGEEKGDVLL